MKEAGQSQEKNKSAMIKAFILLTFSIAVLVIFRFTPFKEFLIKGIFITLGTMGLASMWEAVFADMGTALVAVANSTRIFGKRNANT